MPAVPVAPLAVRAATSSISGAAVAASRASASASSTATDYVRYTGKLKGSRIWSWDGRSSISLIFIVALILGLIALFVGLVALSRLLARTNAPSTEAVLPFERRNPHFNQQAPSMSQMTPSMRPPFDDKKTPLSPLSSGLNSSSYIKLPNPRYPMSTPGGSSASSSQNVIAPLLSSVPPVGSRLGRNRRSTRADGPPPKGSLKRNSRYSSSNANPLPGRQSSQRSNVSSSHFHSTDETHQDTGVRRVQSIGRGNSLRYTRSNEVDEPEAALGRKNSARLAAKARARRSQSHAVEADVHPPQDLSPGPAVGGSSEESHPYSYFNGDSALENLSHPPAGRRGY